MINLKFKGEYFNSTKGAVHIDDDYTQKMIDEVVQELTSLDNPDGRFRWISTGDTLVIGARWAESEEIDIIVTQNYYNACLLKDSYGNYEPLYWGKEGDEEYEDMTKDELIDRIKYLESRRAEYNPKREV